MKLSAPVFVLKSRAKDLKNSRHISLSEALDKIARQEGYSSWSLLTSRKENLLPNRYTEVLDFLNAGDLVLVAARPLAGKTLFVAGLVAQSFEANGATSHFFTLVDREADSRKRIAGYLASPQEAHNACKIDCSDEINADYMTATIRPDISPGSLIVVDYLQMLDEKRTNPPIQSQVEKLKAFCKETGCIMIFTCQLDRSIGARADQTPGVDDIRLPNPLDLGLFNKVIFLHRDNNAPDQVEVSFSGKTNHQFSVGLDMKARRLIDLKSEGLD